MVSMKIKKIFHVGNGSILCGELKSSREEIRNSKFLLFVDGDFICEVLIDFEVLSDGNSRDLFTKSRLDFTDEFIEVHEVTIQSLADFSRK